MREERRSDDLLIPPDTQSRAVYTLLEVKDLTLSLGVYERIHMIGLAWLGKVLPK